MSTVEQPRAKRSGGLRVGRLEHYSVVSDGDIRERETCRTLLMRSLGPSGGLDPWGETGLCQSRRRVWLGAPLMSLGTPCIRVSLDLLEERPVCTPVLFLRLRQDFALPVRIPAEGRPPTRLARHSHRADAAVVSTLHAVHTALSWPTSTMSGSKTSSRPCGRPSATSSGSCICSMFLDVRQVCGWRPIHPTTMRSRSLHQSK